MGSPVPARTARRERLTAERIVTAAIDVADREGVPAITMRRLAEELGVHPTSMYNHLPSKEAILDGVADQLIVEAGLPTSFDTWQDWIRAMARGLQDIARAHPGAFLVFTQRGAVGPAASAHTEGALDAFRRGGFSPLTAAKAVTGCSLALLGVALNECPPETPFPAPDFSHLSPERFPRIHEASDAALGHETEIWELIVDSLIRGLAAAADQESHPSARRPGRPARR